MKRLLFIAVLCAALLPSVSPADHVPTTVGVPGSVPAGASLVQGGDMRFIANAQSAGRGFAAVFGETAPIQRAGRRYILAATSTYGFSVIDITKPLAPTVVSEYASAFGCPDANVQAAQHGGFGVFTPTHGFENDLSMTSDGRIVVLGMDESGRCHDAEFGGLEFIDLTDITKPRTLHLTRNVGEAHSVTVDPKRPIAYISSSDSQDFIEMVDFRSCLGGVAAIDVCKPQVARAVLDPAFMPGLKNPSNPHRDKARSGCHDLRFRGDLAYCAAVGSTLILDVARVAGPDGKLTGRMLTAGEGACSRIPAARAPGVMVTDCSKWTKQMFGARHATPAAMRLVSVITHDGSKPADQDIAISHQAEAIADGRIMIITDERGGGLVNDKGCPGGGVWFYDIRDPARPVLMRTPDGGKAVYITQRNAPPPISASPSCTVHYGQEFADENLLVFAWYANGTRVVRYTPDFSKSPATVKLEEVGAWLSAGSVAIHSMGLVRNPDDPGEVVIYAADDGRGVDVLGLKTPRITRAQAFGHVSRAPTAPRPGPPPKRKPRVLGVRQLPVTGTNDGAATGFALLALSAMLGSAVHRVRVRASDL